MQLNSRLLIRGVRLQGRGNNSAKPCKTNEFACKVCNATSRVCTTPQQFARIQHSIAIRFGFKFVFVLGVGEIGEEG